MWNVCHGTVFIGDGIKWIVYFKATDVFLPGIVFRADRVPICDDTNAQVIEFQNLPIGKYIWLKHGHVNFF